MGGEGASAPSLYPGGFMAVIRQGAFVPRPKEQVEADIAALNAAYSRPCPLRAFPGARACYFRAYHSGEVVPAYLLTAPNGCGNVFTMPDFVRYDGMTSIPSSNQWSHDALHNVENNVRLNTPHIKHDFKELIDIGREDARWRDGVLGRSGVLDGKTVILCAPGPSLAGKAGIIAEYRRLGAVVMSLNRAMRYIQSDYCVAVERYTPDEWRDEAAMKLQEEATLISVPQAHFAMINAWRHKDRIYWGRVSLGSADEKFRHLKWIDAMASTSAAVAVRCAYEMGAGKIILVGFDYSAPFRLEVQKLDLAPDTERELFGMYRETAEAIVNGRGPEAANRAADSIAKEDELRKNGYSFKWSVDRFYFDQDFSKTPYINDARFNSWVPVQACDGRMVGSTRELFLYADQIKAVFGCIESGSECRIISATPEGILDWSGVEGTVPHPPMSLEKAIRWDE